MEKYLNTKQCARLAECSTRRIVAAIRAGRLTASRFGSYYAISRRDLQVYFESRNLKKRHKPIISLVGSEK